MPIILSDRQYPESFQTLESQGIPLIKEDRALHQDIRPLRIGLLNLMPTAVLKDTEEQFFSLIGSTPLQIIPELVCFDQFSSSEERKQHLDAFYRPFSQIQKEGLDGLIVTGANLEEVPFEKVEYWEELKTIFSWARENVASTLFSCWGTHAALKHFYGIKRESYIDNLGNPRKITGVFSHHLQNDKISPLTRGLPEEVLCPHSRWKGISPDQVAKHSDLKILLSNQEAGILLASGRNGREVYIQGHPEYERDALKKEFQRDSSPEKFGKNAPFPLHYFPENNPNLDPKNTWRGTGTILFHNWINFVYQTTHFDLQKVLMVA